MTVDKVRELWEKHELSPVPFGFRGIVVNGLTVTQIHCDIAANIMTFINTGGHLGSHRINALAKTKQALELSIEQLPAESKGYLQNLKQISDMVLEHVQ